MNTPNPPVPPYTVSGRAMNLIADLAAALQLSVKAVEKNIKQLKDAGLLRRVGPDRGGHWEVV